MACPLVIALALLQHTCDNAKTFPIGFSLFKFLVPHLEQPRPSRYLTLAEMSELVRFQLALLDPEFRHACKQAPSLICDRYDPAACQS